MIRNLGWTLVLAGVCGSAAAAEDMPELDHPWTDGLYSTVTIPFAIGEVPLKNECRIWLEVPGLKKPLKVHAVLQEKNAPLVVILNGTFGLADGPIPRLWMSWLAERGFHVATFDSTFHPRMTKILGHGVAGNLEEEAAITGKIIKSLLESRELKSKVARIGVVGMSYGGTQALLLARLAKKGQLGFGLDGVQAYSPPVSFAAAIRRLDESFTYDWKLSDHFWEFYNLQREYPLTKEYDREMMNAAIARVFRLDLSRVIETNDRLFDGELDQLRIMRLDLPKEDPSKFIGPSERLPYADVIGFRQYMRHLVVPYWRARGKIVGEGELLNTGELDQILKDCGSNAEVVLTTNDPLNDEGAAQSLARRSRLGSVVLLPRGGHLGFANAQWTRLKLTKIFDKETIAEGGK